jgi:hypothetical protein
MNLTNYFILLLSENFGVPALFPKVATVDKCHVTDKFAFVVGNQFRVEQTLDLILI